MVERRMIRNARLSFSTNACNNISASCAPSRLSSCWRRGTRSSVTSRSFIRRPERERVVRHRGLRRRSLSTVVLFRNSNSDTSLAAPRALRDGSAVAAGSARRGVSRGGGNCRASRLERGRAGSPGEPVSAVSAAGRVHGAELDRNAAGKRSPRECAAEARNCRRGVVARGGDRVGRGAGCGCSDGDCRRAASAVLMDGSGVGRRGDLGDLAATGRAGE